MLSVRAATASGAQYQILDLGIIDGQFSRSEGYNSVNDSGQVVGSSMVNGNRDEHAFRSPPNGRLTTASDLGGYRDSHALGINASGQVVGYTDDFLGGAYRTAPNGRIDAASNLDAIGSRHSIAYGVNASGQAAGLATFHGYDHAFRTGPNAPIDYASDLGTLGGYLSAATGINNAGQVTGNAELPGAVSHAFRTAPNAPITPASDLGTLGGLHSGGGAINSSGQVAGYSYTTGDQYRHAFRTARLPRRTTLARSAAPRVSRTASTTLDRSLARPAFPASPGTRSSPTVPGQWSI